MFRRFLEEEKAQTALEYMMLAGGVIVTAVVVLGLYSSMSRSTATMLNQSVGEKVSEMADIINNTSI